MPAPFSYLARYVPKLSFTVPGEICGETGPVDISVDVKRYSNTGSTPPTPRQNVLGLDKEPLLKFGWKGRIQSFLTKYQSEKPGSEPFPWTVTPGNPGSLPAKCTWNDIQNVYQGKGSPGEIKAALLLFASYDQTNDVIVRRKWPSPEALEKAANDHCVERIGLDCLGFVVNFVKFSRAAAWSAEDVGNIDMPRFTGYSKGAWPLRKSLDSIHEGDIIVYLQKNDLISQAARHIAVIDSFGTKSTKSAEKVRIAESYGGVGPQAVTVKLEPFLGGEGTYGKVFTLTRDDNTQALVYLVPFDHPII